MTTIYGQQKRREASTKSSSTISATKISKSNPLIVKNHSNQYHNKLQQTIQLAHHHVSPRIAWNTSEEKKTKTDF